MAIDINIPIEDAVTDGSLNPVTSNAVFDAIAALPSTSGFVPYTGATNDVNLGVHDLTATQGTFATSGNPDTLTVNHSSGSGKALTITKGGNGEGVYVNKTSGSGNAVTIIGDLEATNLKRTGGTSSQFLKANGSIDSTSYQPTLVSGTNIKTVNGNSLLGSGDLVISGGGGVTVGTTAVTSGTVGRVFFQGTGDVVQQDAGLSWNNTNKKLTVANSFALNGSAGTGFTSMFSIFRGATEVFKVDEYKSQFTGSVYMNSIVGAGVDAILFGNQSGGGNLITMSPTQGKLAIGYGSPTYNAALDVRAQGALSTDIAFRVRNSANTQNLVDSAGNGSFFLRANTGDMHFNFDPANSRIHLKRTGIYSITTDNAVTALELSCNVGNSALIAGSNRFNIINGGNFHFEETSGILSTSGAGAIVMKNRTAPSTNVVDRFYLYSADIVAGNAAPHFRTENGNIIKLYRETTGIAAAAFVSNTSLIVNDSATYGGYTMGQVVAALKAQGLLA